MKITKYTKI